MAYCNRLVTGTSIQDSRSICKFKNVIRIMTTFSKKKKKKKKKDFSLNVIAKTYLQDFNFERYFS